MKHAYVLIAVGVLAAGCSERVGTAAANDDNKKPVAQASVPPPVSVEVVAVDPKTKTITVREIAAVPLPPGKPATVEVELPVTSTATGQKLGDVKAGEQVEITCSVKPTVHPTAGVPIVVTDCAKVVKIVPKS